MKFMKLAEARFTNFIWNDRSCKILYIRGRQVWKITVLGGDDEFEEWIITMIENTMLVCFDIKFIWWDQEHRRYGEACRAIPMC